MVVTEIAVVSDFKHRELLDKRSIERHYAMEVVLLEIQVFQVLHSSDELGDRPVELVRPEIEVVQPRDGRDR